MTSDNSTIITLNFVPIRCVGDGESTWGNALAFVNRADNAINWLHLKTPLDLGQPPTTTADPCDRKVNDSVTTLDLTLEELVVNRDATATNNTLVWSSGMTGDPEVFAGVTTGGTTKVYNISGNRKM